MKKICKAVVCTLLCAAVFAIGAVSAMAENIKVPDATHEYANDFAGILSENTKQQINAESKQLESEKGIQFVVVTVENLNGVSVEDYANALFNQWGIGDKTTDKGILFLISQKDRKDKIEVGNGLQGEITDIDSKDLLDTGVPYLKQNNFDAGVRQIYVNTLKKLGIQPSAVSAPESQSAQDRNGHSRNAVPGIIIAVILLLLFSRKFHGGPRSFGGGFRGFTWLGRFGGFNDFGGGDSSFGGGSGGFGGFNGGGGSSDGGGASGSF
jgi:uncharacterized protein